MCLKVGSNGVAAPNLRLNTGYIKNKSHGSESISVTINNIWLKCYLNFNKIVADGMRSLNLLAIALNGICLVFERNIKIVIVFLQLLFSCHYLQHILAKGFYLCRLNLML